MKTTKEQVEGNKDILVREVEIIDRDITLEDVLLAIAKVTDPEMSLDLTHCNIWLRSNPSEVCRWQLNTLLHLQDQPTIDFISSLLEHE